MVGVVEVTTVAFVTQLAVLPGEKVQFIIAGLATRYDPRVVVAAAGTAFAGWTALEVWFGAAVRGVLSPVALDAVTAALFAFFAVVLVRSAPAPDETGLGGDADTDAGTAGGTGAAHSDGGVEPVELPDVTLFGRDVDGLGGFVPIFVLLATGEVGDKTQLVTIGLAVQYGAHPGIWLGEMLAILPVSLANAYLFHRFSHRFDVRRAHLAGAALFGFLAADAVLSITAGVSLWETAVSTAADAVLGRL
jgi:putative Ca2+/H+ antiporter (TMEM165/GDT1 family)